jgi:putative Mg2+ transporter-C (MgtC) family protein
MTPTEIEIITKLVISMLLGMIIGIEREFNRSPAGIKTYSIVCLGSTVFALASLATDPRAAAGIITGIGFLGAAMIFRTENKITGLTTAALIWAVAAIGFVVGTGMFFAAIATTILLIIILVPVELAEKKLFKTHEKIL